MLGFAKRNAADSAMLFTLKYSSALAPVALIYCFFFFIVVLLFLAVSLTLSTTDSRHLPCICLLLLLKPVQYSAKVMFKML